MRWSALVKSQMRSGFWTLDPMFFQATLLPQKSLHFLSLFFFSSYKIKFSWNIEYLCETNGAVLEILGTSSPVRWVDGPSQFYPGPTFSRGKRILGWAGRNEVEESVWSTSLCVSSWSCSPSPNQVLSLLCVSSLARNCLLSLWALTFHTFPWKPQEGALRRASPCSCVSLEGTT